MTSGCHMFDSGLMFLTLAKNPSPLRARLATPVIAGNAVSGRETRPASGKSLA